MQRESVIYQADGLSMRGQLFCEPAAGKRAGVLVFPEAFGLGPLALAKAERLAGMGYVALACDLHGEGLVVNEMAEMQRLLGALHGAPDRIRARAKGGFDALVARSEVDADRIASIGFCFGGTMSLELARSGAALKAVVGFHCGLATAAPATDARAIRAKVLVCIGAADTLIPAEQRAAFETEMTEAGVDWQMHLYGGVGHSFTNPDADGSKMAAIKYDAKTDVRSWAALTAMFGEALR